MSKTPRWIRPMLAEAALCDSPLPWERGRNRASMIARRSAGGMPGLRSQPT